MNMFWNKKEEKELPDLPPIKSPFTKEFSPAKSNPVEQPKINDTNLPEENNSENENENGELEKHSLPSFPDSPIAKGFSQAAIKDAINQDEIKEETPEMPPKIPEKINIVPEKKFKTVEMDEPDGENSKSNPFLSSMNSQIQKNKKEKKPMSYTPSYSRNDSFSIGLPPVEKEEEMDNEINKEVEEPLPNKNPTQKGDIFVKIDKFFSAKKALDSIDDQVNEIDSLLNKIRETKLKEEKELANWEKQITLIKSRIQNINDNIFEKTQ